MSYPLVVNPWLLTTFDIGALYALLTEQLLRPRRRACSFWKKHCVEKCCHIFWCSMITKSILWNWASVPVQCVAKTGVWKKCMKVCNTLVLYIYWSVKHLKPKSKQLQIVWTIKLLFPLQQSFSVIDIKDLYRSYTSFRLCYIAWNENSNAGSMQCRSWAELRTSAAVRLRQQLEKNDDSQLEYLF